MKRVLIAIVALALCFSLACKETSIEQEGQTPEVPLESQTLEEEQEKEEEESAFGEFKDLVASGADSDQLGIFIKDNIGKLSAQEAEAMIEALVIEQQQAISEMNGLIYMPEYMDALNNEMKGILDPDLIPSIENEEIRSFYQAISDGYLTVIRYEESPTIETNWEAIYGLGEFFSDDFEEMTYLLDKVQNYRYDRINPDFKSLYEDAVRTEELIKKNDSSFLTWQLDMLYNRQIGNLFIGPEGSYMDAFINKSGEPYTSIVEAAKEYPEAEISKLAMKLDESQSNDYNSISKQIDAHKAFGLKSSAQVVIGDGSGAEETENLFFVSIKDNPDAENKINNLIKDSVMELKKALGVDKEIFYGNRVMFANSNYLNIAIYVSASDESGKFLYRDKNMVLDMHSGEIIGLEDIFEMPWQKLKGQLEDLTGKTIEENTPFYIGGIGIELEIERPESEYSDYAVITYDKVARYVSMEKFYK